MKTIHQTTLILAIIVVLILGGCTLPREANLTDIQLETAAAQTAAAEAVILTQDALQETSIAEETEVGMADTDTPQPTFTSTVTLTPTPTATFTPTPRPTNTPKPTPTPIPCNWASFIMDVTVSDNAVFTPGTEFTKVWRVQNIGACTWDEDYEVIFYDGDELGEYIKEFNREVRPGEYLDVAVDMVAPDTTGHYKGYWIFQDDTNERFGVSATADNPFWVEINVVNPEHDYKYNFAANFCDAHWRDQQEALYCQGTPFAETNYVQITDSPVLEDGRTENEFALWMNVNRGDAITGTYPAITIENGDHFLSEIGCLEESRECRAEFVLNYRVEGSNTVTELGSWTENHNENMRVINIDLSDLAGKDIIFILEVRSLTNTVSNRPVWLIPTIRNP